MKQYKINEIFEVVSGSTPSTSQENYWDGDIKWITPKDLSKLNSAVISDTERQITKDGLDSCSTHIIPKDSIIISSRAPIGYVAILGDEMCCNQGCKALVPTGKIDPYYFFYLLKTKNKQLNDLGTGSTFKELSKTKLEDFKISVTDIQTQNEISTLLIKIDKARQLRKQANALTDKFLQSTFLSMFGDPAINPKGFQKIELKNFYSKKKDGTKCGPFGSALKKEEYTKNGVPVWVMDNISNGRFNDKPLLHITSEKYNQLKSYSVENGDIIISRAGTVGKMCIVESRFPKSIISTNLISLSLDPDMLLPVYFVTLMTYFAARVGKLRKGEDGAFTHMNTGILNNLEIPAPPIKLQQQFADIVTETEQLRQRQRAHEAELDQLFKGLLQKYFG